MPIDLYFSPASSPSRAVYILAKELGIEVNLKPINLAKREHLGPELLAVNPLHTVPCIVDDGFILYKSHAIMAYFINKYAKDDKLYPKDPQKRAEVDKIMMFNVENLFQPLQKYAVLQIYYKQPANPNLLERGLEGVKLFNNFLEKTKYAAGDHLTIADFGLITDFTTLACLDEIDLKDYPHIDAWVKRVGSEISFYEEINEPGLEVFRELVATIDK